ncbi:MAG: polysaccharide lyase beta-sandwich domain-containing protein, partial [Stackebrandtia sp.]
DEVTRDYVTVFFDHGAAPKAASYEYTVLPDADAEATAAYAADPQIVVSDNTADVHAVTGPGVLAANFWNPGTAAGTLTADAASSVCLAEADGTVTIAVADPKQSDATITITLARTVSEVVEADGNVTVTIDGDTAKITVDSAGKAGLPSQAVLAV